MTPDFTAQPRHDLHGEHCYVPVSLNEVQRPRLTPRRPSLLLSLSLRACGEALIPPRSCLYVVYDLVLRDRQYFVHIGCRLLWKGKMCLAPEALVLA